MRDYSLSIDGRDIAVSVKCISADRAEIEVEGKIYHVDIHSVRRRGMRRPPMEPAQSPGPKPPPTPSLAPADAVNGVRAPIPGAILAVFVADGETVEAGAPLLKMEAMKMENVINAPVGGKIVKVHVAVGAAVNQGQLLVELG